MTGSGTVMADLTGLTVRFGAQAWEFVLRRDDFGPEPAFSGMTLDRIHARDVARFLPNWDSLAWVPVPDNLLSRAECWARDWPYQINLRARTGSRLERRELVDAFRAFMSHAPR